MLSFAVPMTSGTERDSAVMVARFVFEKGETRGGGTAPPGPMTSGTERDSAVMVARFVFEKGETRGGGTAPPGPK